MRQPSGHWMASHVRGAAKLIFNWVLSRHRHRQSVPLCWRCAGAHLADAEEGRVHAGEQRPVLPVGRCFGGTQQDRLHDACEESPQVRAGLRVVSIDWVPPAKHLAVAGLAANLRLDSAFPRSPAALTRATSQLPARSMHDGLPQIGRRIEHLCFEML